MIGHEEFPFFKHTELQLSTRCASTPHSVQDTNKSTHTLWSNLVNLARRAGRSPLTFGVAGCCCGGNSFPSHDWDGLRQPIGRNGMVVVLVLGHTDFAPKPARHSCARLGACVQTGSAASLPKSKARARVHLPASASLLSWPYRFGPRVTGASGSGGAVRPHETAPRFIHLRSVSR